MRGNEMEQKSKEVSWAGTRFYRASRYSPVLGLLSGINYQGFLCDYQTMQVVKQCKSEPLGLVSGSSCHPRPQQWLLPWVPRHTWSCFLPSALRPFRSAFIPAHPLKLPLGLFHDALFSCIVS